MKLVFRLNKIEKRIEISDPGMPLVFFLRDELGLTGTKYGCLEGLCGACTVHVDGEPARACQITLADIQGTDITTIEGLSEDASHPVQRAWIELDVAQCGYCQPGQIMQAVGFLTESSNPDEAEIAAAMEGNLCRCGTGPRILAAVRLAADLMEGE